MCCRSPKVSTSAVGAHGDKTGHHVCERDTHTAMH